jgi:outer membrane lipoprotein
MTKKIIWRKIQPLSLAFFLAVVLLGVTGCTHVLPPAAREEVNPYLDLQMVKESPDSHMGQTLLVGGLIVGHEGTPQGSRLEVLSYTLDRWGRPLRADEDTGRFLAESERILDPALYEKGRQVTLSGRVLGELTRPLGDSIYRYPLLEVRAIYLWPKHDPYADRIYSPYHYPYWPYYHPYYYPYRPYPLGPHHPWW